MGEKKVKNTYELYEMLSSNFQQKSVRGRRVEVNEQGSNNEMTMKIAELIKQVKLLATQNTLNQEVHGFCSVHGYDDNTFSLPFNSYASNEYE